MPTIRVARNDWWQVVELVRKQSGQPNLPIYACMLHYVNICAVSVISPLSFKLWALYRSIDGTRNETYRSYIDLPAFWVDACTLIQNEIDRLERIKAKRERQQRTELFNRLENKN